MTHAPASLVLAALLLGGSLSAFASAAVAKEAAPLPASERVLKLQARAPAPHAAALTQAAFARPQIAIPKSETPIEATEVKPRPEWFSDEGVTVSGGTLRVKTTF